MDTQTLTQTGTYTVWVSHVGTNFGSVTLQLKSVPADITSSITIGGSAFTFTTVAGQNANVTFTNPQSQKVTVHWTGGTYSACTITVTGPSPSTATVGSGSCSGASGAIGLGSSIAGGTYNILIDPPGGTTGGLGVNVTSP